MEWTDAWSANPVLFRRNALRYLRVSAQPHLWRDKARSEPDASPKIAAGMVTSAMGITVANPTDLVKIRMQGQGQLPPAKRPYSSTIDSYKKSVAKDGIKSLWVGCAPNVVRNSVINAAELASYD